MKQFIITGLLGLGFCSVAVAKPSPDPIFQNFGTANAQVVDAIIFYNQGTFTAATDITITNNNPNGNNGISAIPYTTSDTQFFTNTGSGIMTGVPGFVFDTVTSSTIHSANTFFNRGTVEGEDVEGRPVVYSTTSGQTPDFVYSAPLASQLQVYATNIINAGGTLRVGNYGLLKLTGSNVNTANGVLIAGAVNTGGSSSGFYDTNDVTGGGLDGGLFYSGYQFYVSPPGTYDLFWGVSNSAAGALDLSQFDPPNMPSVKVGARDGTTNAGLPFPFNGNSTFASYVYTYPIGPSNTYFNIVFVNTNFVDMSGSVNTNISAGVGFTYDYTILDNQTLDLKAMAAVVQFAMPVNDVITGTVVTNAVYLLDVGAAFSTMQNYDNAGYADGYSRPNAFALTTATPDAWLASSPANAIYTPSLIYTDNYFSSKDVAYQAGVYGAQIGRNPGQLNGDFNFVTVFDSAGTNYSETNFEGNFFGELVDLPDPTNEPARIELTANQLNLSNSRIRAEGMVTINATNMVGSTAGSDWGEINAQLGATNGSLVVSNLFPTNFQRLRGDVYAYSLNWQNLVTNGMTNTYHYHMLIVDQNLGGNFQSAIRNLSLSGSNSVVVQDALYVINQSFFNTSNLTFNSDATFTQSAANLTPANYPNLQNFLNNTNGFLETDSVLDMGMNLKVSPVSPFGRKYTMASITNLGVMIAETPIFQSAIFENDGVIEAADNGSMIIDAAFLGCGLTGSTNEYTGSTNYLAADEDITLSALTMQFTNSQIIAGMGAASVGLLTLQTTTNGQITDFVPGVPSTSAYVTNVWEVTDGFDLPVLPATGDLFGTEIITIATNYTVALHTWAGVDWGATSAGFSNNMVIGHLVLSRQSSTAALHFTGAGAQNGMYVDYLELDPSSLSYSDYRRGLIIDPNLTIYFAACNVEPGKLESIYTNRLVWVPSFAGPNSTKAVPYLGSSNVCMMNANLATSASISFFTNVANAVNQPYVLNDPSNPSITYPCPGDSAQFKDYIVGSGSANVHVAINVSGSGTVTPNLKQSQIALGKTYSLAATPSRGWIFNGWTGSGLPETANASLPVFKFTLENNLMLTANFTPKPFTLVQGTYSGLFLETNGAPVSPANSGWFTLTVAANGIVSGRLVAGAMTYGLNAQFSTNGTVATNAMCGKKSLPVYLQLDMTGASGQVTGYVNNDPTIQLLGNAAPNWTAQKASPYAGRYTLILTNTGAGNDPAGYSFGSLIVDKTGIVTVSGQLADGDAFNQTAPISANGLWPFYSYTGNDSEVVLGWVEFKTEGLHASASIGETNVFWSKAQSVSNRKYSDGFTNVFTLVGSSYNPGAESAGLSLAHPIVVLSGGNDVIPLTNAVAVSGKLTYSSTNLTLTVNSKIGTFNGKIKNAGNGLSAVMNGVVLQDEDSAYGYFLGTNNESDAVLLQNR